MTKSNALTLDKIAAIRELSLGSSREVRVVVGVPVKHGDDYVCPYQIRGIGDENVRGMHGIDGVQALQLTLRVLATELAVMKEDHPELIWPDDSSGSLGF